MRRSLLIIDDDPAVRMLLTEVVEGLGYSVHQADSGEQALIVAQEKTIDAFLSDIDLPAMDGIEVCRRLRALEQYRVTPIILVTALDDQQALETAFSAGCDDFVTKPFNTVVLAARLKAHLQKIDYFRQAEHMQRSLSRYVSPRTQRIVASHSETGRPIVPEEKEVTILFTDVRGFTALSEEIPPQMLFTSLSAHLADQVNLVHRNGGFIDKFGGDGLMAVFDSDGHAVHACLCALQILESVGIIADANSEGLRKLGIGLNTGPVIMGNLGSPEHLDYSVVGNSVNLAARLCGYAEALSVVASKAVYAAARRDRRLNFHSERDVTIRGVKRPVTVYSLSWGQ